MNINTNNTKSLSREDLESGYNHLLQVTRDHIDELALQRKEINNLKRSLQEANTKRIETSNYTIRLNFENNIHSFEHDIYGEDQGGSLTIDGDLLIDYDGVYALPEEIINALEIEGVIIESSFKTLDKITDETKRSNQVGCESKSFFSGWEVVESNFKNI